MSDALSLLQDVLGATTTLLSFLLDVVGIVLAIVNLPKARLPAILLLFGCSVHLLVRVAQQLLSRFVLPDAYLDHQSYLLLFQATSLLFTLANALIILAVFAGRTRS